MLHRVEEEKISYEGDIEISANDEGILLSDIK